MSPVEQKNLELINDPALDSYSEAELAEIANSVSSKFESEQGAGLPNSNGVFSISTDREDDPTFLGRVSSDVLTIGPEIAEIGFGSDGPRADLEVRVDEGNPHFTTDGRALFTQDGRTLVKLIVPCEHYSVPEGCESIGDRAFDSFTELSSLELPNTLHSIGRLAFAKTSISKIDIPHSVDVIDEKAFYCCKKLSICMLSEGIKHLEDGVFANSALQGIQIPASVESVGLDMFKSTPAAKNYPSGSIMVSAQNKHIFLDSLGGLYQGNTLIELISHEPAYVTDQRCVHIGDDAFRRNHTVKSVIISEGVKSIGSNAFRSCRNLSYIELPESLETIGYKAFVGTSLMSIKLSSNLKHIGAEALIINGDDHVRNIRTLQYVELSPENQHFYIESGILCERGAGDGGLDKAILYVGPDPIVIIPDAVNRLAPLAFAGVTTIERLKVHDHLHSICAGSLAVAVSIPYIEFVFKGTGQCLPMPSLSTRYRNMTDLFTTNSKGTLFLYSYYDAWVTNTPTVSEFATCAMARFRNPVRLTEDDEEIYRKIFLRKQTPICIFFAKSGDLESLNDLFIWGLLDDEHINEATEEALGSGNAQLIATLLEFKSRIGMKSKLDLSI